MKKVIVTGASSGIGQAIATRFSQNQWAVLMIARNEEKLAALKKALPNSDYLICDLTEPTAITDLADSLNKGPVDALINNAGIYTSQSVDDDEDSTWDQHYQTNLMSAVRLTRICWPKLKVSQGCVLNISSTLGIRPIPNTAAYSALKAAMNNWTQSLALEGAPLGIRSNALCPGLVDTPIHSFVNSDSPEDKEIYQTVQSLQPLGRTGKPEDIATMAYHLCQDEARWITGTLLNIDGGILLKS